MGPPKPGLKLELMAADTRCSKFIGVGGHGGGGDGGGGGGGSGGGGAGKGGGGDGDGGAGVGGGGDGGVGVGGGGNGDGGGGDGKGGGGDGDGGIGAGGGAGNGDGATGDGNTGGDGAAGVVIVSYAYISPMVSWRLAPGRKSVTYGGPNGDDALSQCTMNGPVLSSTGTLIGPAHLIAGGPTMPAMEPTQTSKGESSEKSCAPL